MKAFVLGALAVAAFAVAGPSLADDHHDDHHAVVVRHPVSHHHAHNVCTVHHGHRVCHMVR
jgi:hypothetical protein